MTDQKIAQMLSNIFPTKPEIPETSEPLTGGMKQVIQAFEQEFGQLEYPVIILDVGDHTGRIDFNQFNQAAITITRNFLPYGWVLPVSRSDEKMARSLAHELGHVVHLQDGIHYGFEDENFGWCEDFADWWRDQFLA